MTLQEFTDSIDLPAPPAGCSVLLQALWHDRRGDWDTAHQLAQDVDDEDGAWVHAYLHRKEGDSGNAAYWYRRAKRPIPADSLPDEWARIVTALI